MIGPSTLSDPDFSVNVRKLTEKKKRTAQTLAMIATTPAWKPTNKRTLTSRQISWSEILTFLSPAGQQQIVGIIRQAHRQRGENWLPEIQAEFPTFSWIAELVSARTADEAFAALQNEYANLPLYLIKGKLFELHGVLNAEIERKR